MTITKDNAQSPPEPLGMCGGIPEPFLYGDEPPIVVSALRRICREKGRLPSLVELSEILKTLPTYRKSAATRATRRSVPSVKP